MKSNITISIVCYNNSQLIGETIQGLKKFFNYGKVYLIDNASTDETLSILENESKDDDRFEVVRSKENVGFGRAHNLVIDRLQSDFHIVMNPDIRVTSDVFPAMAEFLRKNQETGLIVPKLLFEDGSLQPVNTQLASVLDLFLRRFWPKKLKKLVQKRLDWYEMLDIGYDHVYEVPSVTGAFIFCRTDVYKEIGGFDPRYFLYFEDKDLGLEFRKKGYRTLYFPEVSVIHLWQRAPHKSYKMVWVHICNAFKYFNKWGWKLY